MPSYLIKHSRFGQAWAKLGNILHLGVTHAKQPQRKIQYIINAHAARSGDQENNKTMSFEDFVLNPCGNPNLASLPDMLMHDDRVFTFVKKMYTWCVLVIIVFNKGFN